MTRRHATIFVSLLALLVGGAAARAAVSDISETFAATEPGSPIVVDHTIWAGVLKRELKVGADGINRFNYANAAQTERSALKMYLANLQAISPRRLNPAEQHAYWINFYNALTVEVVLEKYPVKSIRDISSGLLSFGPWDRKLVRVDGRELSLNNIEQDILRADWHDPRAHYALNCASLGCPNLRPLPYDGRDLDAELDAAARDFIPRAVALRDGRMTLSRIYRWYVGDFGGSDASIIRHLRKYAAPELASRMAQVSTIEGYQYDWRLNDVGSEITPP